MYSAYIQETPITTTSPEFLPSALPSENGHRLLLWFAPALVLSGLSRRSVWMEYEACSRRLLG